MKSLSFILCAAAFAAVSAGPALADQLLFQQSQLNTTSFAESEVSFSSTGRQIYQFDDFTVAQDATITSVGFAGFKLIGGSPLTMFQVQIASDVVLPSGLGSPARVSTFEQYDSANGIQYQPGIYLSGQFNLFTDVVPFSATLTAGTRYWLSITAYDATSFDFFWAGASGGNNLSYQVDYTGDNTGDPFREYRDLDFSIYGNPIVPAPPTDPGMPPTDPGMPPSNPPSPAATPEPASLLLAGTGLLACAGSLRKRIQSRA